MDADVPQEGAENHIRRHVPVVPLHINALIARPLHRVMMLPPPERVQVRHANRMNIAIRRRRARRRRRRRNMAYEYRYVRPIGRVRHRLRTARMVYNTLRCVVCSRIIRTNDLPALPTNGIICSFDCFRRDNNAE